MSNSNESKYVIQRRNKTTGEVRYLSPGKVNWITVETHEKYKTRYGTWIWGEAEEISSTFNKRGNPEYEYFALAEGKHK
jgi:hypothetical protein